MLVEERAIEFSADDYATATNGAATVTYAAAGMGIRHCISGVAWSFSVAAIVGAPALTIMDGATVVFVLSITAIGPGTVYFDPPRRGSPATGLTVTLDAGGPAVVGRVNVLAHWVEH